MIPPSWSLIKWLYRKLVWNFFLLIYLRALLSSFLRISLLGPLRCSGRTRNSSLCSTTTPSGASALQGHLALWCSTSASGPTRRVPPPRGSPPRFPPRAFPSSSASSSPLSLYEAFLIPRFVACGPSSGVAHSPFFTAYLFLAALCYTRWVPVPGQTDVFSRLRSTSPSTIVFCTCPLFCVRVPRCLGVQGRSDVFPDRVQVHGLFHLCVFLPFHCLRGCELRVAPPFFSFFLKKTFKWRGQAFDFCRLSGFHCSAELEWNKLAGCLRVSKSSDSRRLEDWLSLISRFPLNSVLTLCSACLEG